MDGHLETLLLSLSLLIIFSILIARLSNNLGVPVLLLFLGVGMLAGSEGPGGIYFDDAALSQSIGIVSLIFILFSGGLDTKWSEVRPALWPSISLATIGVVVTTTLAGLFVCWVFKKPLGLALLLGAVVASTDAAAVFSIIGARHLKLKGRLTAVLELESGTNDPMAVFLTISIITYLTSKEISYTHLIIEFILEMGLGLLVGWLSGKAIVWFINKLKFPIEGFYPVFTLAFAIFCYSFADFIHGSGFLAVYVAGLVVRNHNIVHKKTILRFFEGVAWLAQIGMFITLGLLVFPSQLLNGFAVELVIALFLILVARPVSVFLSLAASDFNWREKTLISWVGLRGAVPIILATFPMLAGIPGANWIFNVVFFIVLTSALLQGWPLPLMAKWLKLDEPYTKAHSPVEFSEYEDSNMKLINLSVPLEGGPLVNKSLVEVSALKGSLVVTVLRENRYFVPSGGTVLLPGDHLQVLVDRTRADEIAKQFD